MAMRFIHVQQIVPYCLIPFVPFLGIPVPVTTETIHANKTIKIRSCYFSFSMCRSEKFDVSEIQDSCVGAHWGTPLFIRNEYVPTRVHVHNEMPSFSGRPRWTCRKNFQSRDPEVFLCHHGTRRPPHSETNATRVSHEVMACCFNKTIQSESLWQGDFALQTDPVASPFFAQPVDFSGQEKLELSGAGGSLLKF